MKKINNDKDIKEMIKWESSITDPDGSYTGKPKDMKEKPVQDADDL